MNVFLGAVWPCLVAVAAPLMYYAEHAPHNPAQALSRSIILFVIVGSIAVGMAYSTLREPSLKKTD